MSGNAARRMAAVLAATTATLLLTLGVGVGASSAAGNFGPHNPHVQQPVASPSLAQRPHDVAPLTLTNIIVTDLASDVGNVYSYTTTSPVYSTDDNCNVGATDRCA